MRLELDWVCGVIRIGGEDFRGPEPGTKYDFVCSIMRKGDEAYLFAAHGIMNRAVFTKIKTTLREAGIKKVTYERFNTETKREREVFTHV